LYKKLIVMISAGLLLLSVVVAHSSEAKAVSRQAGAQPCDRACLTGVIDQYLAALVAHDPSRLPLSPQVKFTEDTAPLQVGQGLWRTISGVGPYKHYFVDTTAGQAGFIGVIQENGHPARLTLRLKVEDGKITEIETIVVREGELDFSKSPLTAPKAIWLEAVPPNERSSRENMIRIANLYFEGIEHNTADIVPFDPDCVRTENGIQTTSNPNRNSRPTEANNPVNFSAMGIREQFDAGSNAYIEGVNPRRFLIVDEENGLVFGFFRFSVNGTVTSMDLKGAGKVSIPAAYQRPLTGEIAELFKIKDGKIREIEAEFISVPYHLPDGWSN
jgi:hypothetical protein